MNVPKLRFKDEYGEDFPEWKVHQLGDIGSIVTGKTPSTTDGSLWGGDVLFVTPSDMTDDKYQFTTQRTVTNTGKIKILPKHSIMFTCIASIGKMSLSVFPCITNQQINTLIPKSDFDNEFIYYALSNIVDYIKSTQANTTLPIINKTEFSKFTISVPVRKEQARISDFLTAVDEKISQLTKKCDLLTQYKKGVMQKIFSQELRFKDEDGRDFPEWEERALGDVCKPQQWTTISSAQLHEEGYPVYGANGFIGYYDSYNHEYETVAVTCRGATCGEVSLIPAQSYITGNSMCLDEIDPKLFSERFIYYAMKYRGFKDVISGSAQPQIVGSAIRKAEFKAPILPEQAKIAHILSVLDDKITATQSQLNAVKQYKQGLLQQMFV